MEERVIRFRLGNEMRQGEYWEGVDKRTCRLCGSEEETWEHVWEGCRAWDTGGKSYQEVVGWILGEKEEREEWMRKIEEERKEEISRNMKYRAQDRREEEER